jgi:outer membrane protein assembly factor BamE
MRAVFSALIALSLCGCGMIYKLPTRQGNVLDQKDLDKVQVGMSHQQVQFLLGTPIAASSMRPDRWDYLAYYKNPRGKAFSRTVTMYFNGDTLASIEGEKAITGKDATQPDFDQITKEEKKAATEEERAKEKTDTGVVITQPKKKD